MQIIVTFFGLAIVAFCLIFIWSLIAALPLMWLWNWLMPELFGLQTIGFLQALGLNILCGILFRSSSSSSSSSSD